MSDEGVPAGLAEIAEVTDTTFGEIVLRTAGPALVEFWAPWAASALPVGDDLLREAAAVCPGVRLLRLNVEDNPMAATVYGVHSVPLCVLFRGEQELDRWEGALEPARLLERLRAACGEGAAGDAR